MKINEILIESDMVDILMMSGSSVRKAKVPHANLKNMEVVGHQVIDRDGSLVGKPIKSSSTARRKVDKLDDKHGGVRYHKQPVYKEAINEKLGDKNYDREKHELDMAVAKELLSDGSKEEVASKVAQLGKYIGADKANKLKAKYYANHEKTNR